MPQGCACISVSFCQTVRESFCLSIFLYSSNSASLKEATFSVKDKLQRIALWYWIIFFPREAHVVPCQYTENEPENGLGWKAPWQVIQAKAPAAGRDIFHCLGALGAPTNLTLGSLQSQQNCKVQRVESKGGGGRNCRGIFSARNCDQKTADCTGQHTARRGKIKTGDVESLSYHRLKMEGVQQECGNLKKRFMYKNAWKCNFWPK